MGVELFLSKRIAIPKDDLSLKIIQTKWRRKLYPSRLNLRVLNLKAGI
jgi:hypothetical protein